LRHLGKGHLKVTPRDLQAVQREANAIERDVDAVASMLPTSWIEAVASYLHTRKLKLAKDIHAQSEFDARVTGNRVYALDAISAYVGAEVKEKPSITADKPVENRHERDVRLASLLCPSGWRDKVRPVLEGLRVLAQSAAVEASRPSMPCLKPEKVSKAKKRYQEVVGETVGIAMHQAIATETIALLRFHEAVEARGGEAAAKLQDIESAQRAFGARPPWQNRAVRAAAVSA